MIDITDLLWSFSQIISLLLHLLQVVTRPISMARSSNSPSSSAHPPPFSWVCFPSTVFASKAVVEESQPKSPVSGPELSDPHQSSCTQKSCLQEDSCDATLDFLQEHPRGNSRPEGWCPVENSCFGPRNLFEEDVVFGKREFFGEKSEASRKEGLDSLDIQGKVPRKIRKRPAKIVIPETREALGFGTEVGRDLGEEELHVQGSSFCLVSKKGRRKILEDGYSVITDISGDSRQVKHVTVSSLM